MTASVNAFEPVRPALSVTTTVKAYAPINGTTGPLKTPVVEFSENLGGSVEGGASEKLT